MPLTLFRLANWPSWPRSSASAKTLHGTSKSIPISMKAEGCGQYRTKCAKIFARAGLRTCRDWQNAPAFSGSASKNCRHRCRNSRAKNTRSGTATHITRRCILRNGAMGFVLFGLEIIIAPLVCVSAMWSHGSGSEPTNSTTAFGFDFCAPAPLSAFRFQGSQFPGHVVFLSSCFAANRAVSEKTT